MPHEVQYIHLFLARTNESQRPKVPLNGRWPLARPFQFASFLCPVLHASEDPEHGWNENLRPLPGAVEFRAEP